MRLASSSAIPVILAAFGALSSSAQTVRPSSSLAPYVPSPQPVVDKMLESAELKPGEVIYDLGCGDGRILITAAQKFRAKGIGVELSPKLARQAEDRIKQMNLEDDIRIIQADMLDVDISSADVVTIYLLTLSNEKLRPKLERLLRPGARVVSHDFKVRGWEPSKVEKVHVLNRAHTIYVYVMPAGKP